MQRQPGLYYLVTVSAPKEQTVLANAQFLVEHGMSDVTIEQKSNGMFYVVTVSGFAKLVDPQADALRNLAIEIGRQHPDARKVHRSVYYDAYYTRIARR